MNSETGKVYSGPDEIAAGTTRGEKLVLVSERAAKFIREARASKARRLKANRRRHDAIARASRKQNRQ